MPDAHPSVTPSSRNGGRDGDTAQRLAGASGLRCRRGNFRSGRFPDQQPLFDEQGFGVGVPAAEQAVNLPGGAAAAQG